MSDQEPDKKVTRESSSVRMARLSAIVTILPASMAAGWIMGYFVIDRYFNVFPWGTIILTLFGAAAGFYEIVKILQPDGSQDDRSPNGKS